jgi:UPF0716 protein FxsA
VLLRLLLLFTLVPFLELILLLWIAEQTNWIFTVALVIFTGVLGAALARHEGLRCLREVRQRLNRGEVPAGSLVDALLIFIAGALLVTPGVLTDLAGFSLLVPPVRQVIKRYVTERLRARLRVVSPFPDGQARGEQDRGGDRILDVRIVDVESREPQGEKGDGRERAEKTQDGSTM